MNETVASLLKSFSLILPEIVLGLGACVIFLGGLFRADRRLWAVASLLTLLAAALAWAVPVELTHTPLGSRAALYAAPVLPDPLALFVRLLALGGGAVLVLFSWDEVPNGQASDYHACLLLILAGLSLTGAANDLVFLFVSLELISIPTYVLLYLPRHDAGSQEAALKYFLLSVFSSALLLFGFSYLYGIAGSTNLAVLLHTLNNAATVPPIAQVALVMVLAGLGFRIAFVPFHFYAPDVYQGSATVLAAMLAFVPKAAGFAALLRILGFVLPADIVPRGNLIGMGLSEQVPILLWFLATVTMTLGNFLALRQDNLKRLLAYSSVAHAGYMLIALAVAPFLRRASIASHGLTGPDGVEALLYYLVAYGAMTIGAFAVIARLDTAERPVENVDDLAGLSVSHPGMALVMVLFLFSLIGIPLTAGFTGKLLIFFGAMGVPDAVPAEAAPEAAAGHAVLFRVLAVIGVVNAAVGAWYYLRIVAVMYLRTGVRPPASRPAWAGLATLLICAVLTVGLSIPPGADWLLQVVRGASGPRTTVAAPVAVEH